MDTTILAPEKRHCWHHKVSEGHILAADELAAGLRKNKLSGISSVIEVTGANYKAQLAGKKGIVYFEDYWFRHTDNPGNPTGDHIDLWNGSRLTDWKSWVRIQFGLVIPDVWADLEKAKKNSLLENRRMKKIIYSFIGAFLLGGVCIGITWSLGALFGPLYHSEKESSRNFGIFLYAFIFCFIGGAILGYLIAKKNN